MEEKETRRMDDNVKLGLFIVGFATLAFLIAAALTENVFTEWGEYRTQNYTYEWQILGLEYRTNKHSQNDQIKPRQGIKLSQFQ